MRVAHHEHVGFVPAELVGQPPVAAIVSDQETKGRRLHEQELRQAQESRARVVVPAHGLERCYHSQPGQQRLVDHVARHQDAGDAGENLRQERIEAAVQVGHQAEAEGATQDDCSSSSARRQAWAEASSWAAAKPAARLIQACGRFGRARTPRFRAASPSSRRPCSTRA